MTDWPDLRMSSMLKEVRSYTSNNSGNPWPHPTHVRPHERCSGDGLCRHTDAMRRLASERAGERVTRDVHIIAVYEA
jgi:hypothetical protein